MYNFVYEAHTGCELDKLLTALCRM